MENWGLILGGSTVLAMEANSEDLRTKKDIAYTQCHEVAHMWCVLSPHWIPRIRTGQWDRFGNIATMEWWDNLYLNEGVSSQNACMLEIRILANSWIRFRDPGEYLAFIIDTSTTHFAHGKLRWANSSSSVS